MKASGLKIDSEFESLCPSIKDEEYALLRESIAEHGVRDAIVLWNGLVLDGHNRRKIAMEMGLEVKTVSLEFADRDAAKQWILCNQLGRRNLTAIQRSYLIGTVYQSLKTTKRMQNGKGPLRDAIAAQYGVAVQTVRRSVAIAESINDLPPDVKEHVLSGEFYGKPGQIIDLASLGSDFQKRMMRDIRAGKVSGVQEAILKVRPPRDRNAHSHRRCPKCKKAWAPNGGECLGCQQKRKSKPINRSRGASQDQPTDFSGWKDRLAELRKEKGATNDLDFHATGVLDWLDTHKRGECDLSDKTVERLGDKIKKWLHLNK